MFFRRNPFPPSQRGRNETPGQRSARRAMLFLLLVVVGAAFWMNGDRRFKEYFSREDGRTPVEQAAGQSRIEDATGSLSPAQLARLGEYGRRFEERYGVRLAVLITRGPLPRSGPAGFFYIGLNPERQEVVVSAPPLIAGVLGEPLLKDLQNEHFPPYFAEGNWPAGLADALNKITDALESGLGAVSK